MEETAALGEDQDGASAVGSGGAARRWMALYARAEVEEEEEEDCRIWEIVVLPIRGIRRRRAAEAIFFGGLPMAMAVEGGGGTRLLLPSSSLCVLGWGEGSGGQRLGFVLEKGAEDLVSQGSLLLGYSLITLLPPSCAKVPGALPPARHTMPYHAMLSIPIELVPSWGGCPFYRGRAKFV